MAQFAYNNGENIIIGISPFYINYRRYLDIIRKLNNRELEALYIRAYIDIIDIIYTGLKQDIKFIIKKVALYYNNRRIEAPSFKRGDRTFKKSIFAVIKSEN